MYLIFVLVGGHVKGQVGYCDVFWKPKVEGRRAWNGNLVWIFDWKEGQHVYGHHQKQILTCNAVGCHPRPNIFLRCVYKVVCGGISPSSFENISHWPLFTDLDY